MWPINYGTVAEQPRVWFERRCGVRHWCFGAVAVAVLLVASGCGPGDADDVANTAAATKPQTEQQCPELPVPASTTGPPSPPEPVGPFLEPETYRDGDSTVMPVTFPDGTTAEVLYEPSLALERAAISPSTSAGTVPGEGPSRNFLVLFGSLSDRPGWASNLVSAERSRDDVLVCTYHVDPLDTDYLWFEFDDWVVGIHSAEDMTAEVRRTWVRGLDLRVARDGFPVLESNGGLEFTEAGGRAGPHLFFQLSGPLFIEITLGACELHEDDYEFDASLKAGERCVLGTGVKISASAVHAGTPIESILHGLDVRNVVPAS